MAWQNPKIDWSAADGVRDTDLNRIEGNILLLHQTGGGLADNLVKYVSPSGSDDTGDGTADNPFSTIGKALEGTSRNLNGKQLTVHVLGGTYNEVVSIDHFINGEINLIFDDTTYLLGIAVNSSKVFLSGSTLYFTRAQNFACEVLNGGSVICSSRMEVTANRYSIVARNNATFCSSAAVLSYDGTDSVVVASNCSAVHIEILSGSSNAKGIEASGGSVVTCDNLPLHTTGALYNLTGGSRVYVGSGDDLYSASVE